jgi:hypothetical protein
MLAVSIHSNYTIKIFIIDQIAYPLAQREAFTKITLVLDYDISISFSNLVGIIPRTIVNY